MSSVKIEGNASGTGIFTIASPNSNTNRTLTLPDVTGTFNTSGGVNEVPAGSASAPAIYPTGDTNTGIFFPAADTIAFGEGGSEAMRIDSSGNVGIGTTSPAIDSLASLNVKGNGSNSSIVTTQSSDSGSSVAIYSGNGSTDNPAVLFQNNLRFGTTTGLGTTGYTERVRITSGGNVLIGQTSASNSAFLLNCVGGGILTTRVNIGDLGGFSDGSTLYLGSDSTNSSSWNQSNANYRFGSNRGGCVVAINPGGYTYEGGSGTGTRTFAVNSNGNVQNTNNSYGSLSDAKLKENIVDASPKLDDLMKVKIRNFNLIADESKTKQIGVIAQELEEVFPRMIEEHIDYTYEDYVNEYGNNDKKAIPTGTVTKEVKYSVFVPMLIKAVQELKAELDATKAEVAALKGQA